MLEQQALCDVIKQNESEVGNDMFLVSEVWFRFNICKWHLSKVLDWWYIDLIATLYKPWCFRVHKCPVSNSTDLCSKYKTNLKPVTRRSRLRTHPAWSNHISYKYRYFLYYESNIIHRGHLKNIYIFLNPIYIIWNSRKSGFGTYHVIKSPPQM